MKKITREEWLNQLTDEYLRPLFAKNGYTIPTNIRLSCSLPSSRAFAKKKVVGECWYPEASGDGTHEIFCSPTEADSQEVAGTLIHELVHATVGKEAKHGKPFRDCALRVGLEGKMVSTTSSKELIEFLEPAILELGAYPHAKLDYNSRKKQRSRNVLVSCEPCGFKTRAARSQLSHPNLQSCLVCGHRLTQGSV